MENKTCRYCNDEGIAFYPLGKEDYEKDYCTCPAGKKLEEKDEPITRNEAWAMATNIN